MGLTELAIKQAKPHTEKRIYLSDGRGLLLEIRPNGVKSWIVRYFVEGKEKRKHIGEFPQIPIREAREITLRIKGQAKNGDIENLSESQEIKRVIFRDIVNEWFETRIKPVMSKRHIDNTLMRMKKHIIPALGDMEVERIKPSTVLELCRTIEARGTIYTAQRVKQMIGQIFKFAIATDKAENDPTTSLIGALQPKKEKHYAAIIEQREIAHLMKKIHAYPYGVVRIALIFSALTFCRPGEIRHAEWSEIDVDKKEWKIPAEKMKMKKTHIVPLPTQAIELLNELSPMTKRAGKWLFPSSRMDGRPMSENTIRVALRTMGYSNDEMTAHGFRAMASTTLNEQGWTPDIIERQLAHSEGNSVRSAYNHAEYLPERRKMMQHWADFLYGLISM